LIECVEAYEAAYGTALTWAFNAETTHSVPYKRMPTLHELVQGMDENDQIEWYAASGDIDSANAYRITTLTERGWQDNQMSQVCFTLPRDHAYLPERRKKMFELIQFFAKKLSIISRERETLCAQHRSVTRSDFSLGCLPSSVTC